MLNAAKLSDIRTKFSKGFREVVHGDFDVIIAGGAVRDTVLGKPVKDIDIFVCGSISGKRDIQTAFAKGLEEVGECTKYFVRYSDIRNLPTDKDNSKFTRLCKKNLYQSNFSGIQDVIEFKGNHIYQLIWVNNTIEETIKQFDITICQAWIDESGKIKTTSEFKRDSERQVLKFVDAGHYKTSSEERYERLEKKYSGWRSELTPANTALYNIEYLRSPLHEAYQDTGKKLELVGSARYSYFYQKWVEEGVLLRKKLVSGISERVNCFNDNFHYKSH